LDTTFSVVIPCYNYAHVVERAIQSVFDQGGDAFDVTAINDGSTDASGEVLERCARARGPSLRVIHQENRGLSAVRNRGTRETQGDYLIFLDADDELMPAAFSQFRRAIDATDRPAFVIGGHLAIHPKGGRKLHPQPALPELREARFLRYIRNETKIMHGAAAMRRDAAVAIPFDESLRTGEDFLVFAILLARYDCATIDVPVLCHHRHPGSLRHDVKAQEGSRERLPELLFDQDRLPPSFARHRSEFAARCALNLCRTYARAGRDRSALGAYWRALAHDPRVALRPMALREATRALRRWILS